MVWFGEGLDPKVLDQAATELERCDLCLVVSTFKIGVKFKILIVVDKQRDSHYCTDGKLTFKKKKSF